jgi:hypothetical protein
MPLARLVAAAAAATMLHAWWRRLFRPLKNLHTQQPVEQILGFE